MHSKNLLKQKKSEKKDVICIKNLLLCFYKIFPGGKINKLRRKISNNFPGPKIFNILGGIRPRDPPMGPQAQRPRGVAWGGPRGPGPNGQGSLGGSQGPRAPEALTWSHPNGNPNPGIPNGTPDPGAAPMGPQYKKTIKR